MVERIALSVGVVVGVLALTLAVPRYGSTDGSWPDILGQLDDVAGRLHEQSKLVDAAIGVVAVVLLGAAVAVFRDPGLLGGLSGSVEFVAFPLAIIGFAALFTATYVNTRRAGLYRAESSLIGLTLVGTILMVLVVAILLET